MSLSPSYSNRCRLSPSIHPHISFCISFPYARYMYTVVVQTTCANTNLAAAVSSASSTNDINYILQVTHALSKENTVRHGNLLLHCSWELFSHLCSCQSQLIDKSMPISHISFYLEAIPCRNVAANLAIARNSVRLRSPLSMRQLLTLEYHHVLVIRR